MRSAFYWVLLPCVFTTMSIAQEVVMQFDADDLVNYIVMDPHGRRTGVDPRNSPTQDGWLWLNEIPRANYAFESVGNLNPNGVSLVSMQFVYIFNSPEGDGLYTLEIIGNRLGTFDLYVNANGYDTLKIQDVRFVIRQSPIDRDSVQTYKFTYHGPPGSPVSLVKVVSAASLIQDVDAMRKLKWIVDASTAQKYTSLFVSVEDHIRQNNFAGARTTLSMALDELGRDSSSTVNYDAYSKLGADILQFIGELPTSIPPSLVSLTPAFALVHGGPLSLKIVGRNFTAGSTASWNDSPRPTTFPADTLLEAQVFGADVSAISSAAVSVSNTDGGMSNALQFDIISHRSWIDTLVSYKHRAADLGWLKGRRDDDCDEDERPEDGVVRNLDKRLEKAIRELVRRDSVAAREELQKFVKKLDRLRKRSTESERRKRRDRVVITAEGYELLKTNTEYLIDHLPERKRKGDRKGKER